MLIFWRIRRTPSWHSIICTRKQDESENHSWFHLNNLDEPAEELELKHSKNAMICSNSMSHSRSDLQQVEWHITRQHTPTFLESEAWWNHTNIIKVRVMQCLRRAQEENLHLSHHHWTLSSSTELGFFSAKQKKKKAGFGKISPGEKQLENIALIFSGTLGKI